MSVATRSKSSPTLGVIMLNTHFRRIPGDIGNADTFNCNVIYETVGAATVDAIVRAASPQPAVCEAVIRAAQCLQSRGAQAIATSCGFLGVMQETLVASVGVPVMTSALLHLAWLHKVLPQTLRVGVLTFDKDALGKAHFMNLWRDDVVVAGLDPGGELRTAIGNDLSTLDTAKAEREVLSLQADLLGRYPDIGAIILECTNLVPYKHAMRADSNTPIYDVTDLIAWCLGEDSIAAFDSPARLR